MVVGISLYSCHTAAAVGDKRWLSVVSGCQRSSPSVLCQSLMLLLASGTVTSRSPFLITLLDETHPVYTQKVTFAIEMQHHDLLFFCFYRLYHFLNDQFNLVYRSTPSLSRSSGHPGKIRQSFITLALISSWAKGHPTRNQSRQSASKVKRTTDRHRVLSSFVFWGFCSSAGDTMAWDRPTTTWKRVDELFKSNPCRWLVNVTTEK